MAIQKLTLVPNKILRQQSADVQYDKKLANFIKDLCDSLLAQDNPKGVGLSAPQLGKNWNVFVMLTTHKPQIIVNPVITDESLETTFGDDPEEPFLEGCLSIPKIYGPVSRHVWIEAQYATIKNGELMQHRARFADFEARVFQHEYDHLRGVLFTDYSLKYDLPIYELRRGKMIEIDKSFIKTY